MNPRISVIGTGYLGATHAVSVAELGFELLRRRALSDRVRIRLLEHR